MTRPAMILALLVCVVLPGLCWADGLIIVHNPPSIDPGHFSFAPLSVSFHHVSVRVDGQVAVTNVDQEFYNPNPQRMEGTYVFPLPEGAHIDRFSMDIDGVMRDAELLSADKAKALYEEIVRKARDPALLEYSGRGAFTLRIFPIEPHSHKRIKISYTQLLKSNAGLIEYVYPLNTEKFSSAPVPDVAVSVSITAKTPLKSVYCPSHSAEVRRDGGQRAVVSWEERDTRPDTDFKVIWSCTPSPMGIDLLASRAAGSEGYFMLLASPGLVAEQGTILPKDVCFVLDTSGSMAGAKLDQAKKALRFCLANLDARDRFEIVRFSSEAEQLFGAIASADSVHLAQAGRFLDGVKPMGGTDIGDALGRALALGSAGAGRPFMVIFLTDGMPTIGETREDPLVEGVEHAGASMRIFCFGIGNDVNTHLLDRIAEKTRATSQYVLPTEDIEVKVSGFYTKISEPVLSNIALSFSNPGIHVTQLFPARLPDLFNGEQLVVFGRYSGSGASAARITGTFNGKTREFAADVNFPAEDGNAFIPRLWATRRVGWLLDEIRMHGESSELKDEVVRLAREHGIVTPYTAYLVLEDEERRNVPYPMRSFQELGDDQEAAGRAKDRLDSVKKEAVSEKSRSGASAVENALSLNQLKSISNEAQAAQSFGLDKSSVRGLKNASQGYRAAQARNYAQQVRMVKGRAFYQNGSIWTDSTAQSLRGLKNRSVRFASDEYFALLKRNPDAAQWLALGNDVDVVIGGVLYNIRQ